MKKSVFYKRFARLIGFGLVCLMIMLGFTACSSTSTVEEEAPEGAVKVYCTDSAASRLCWEYYVPHCVTTLEQIEELLGRLATVPSSKQYLKVRPDDLRVISYYFGTDGQLIVDFDPSYELMSNVQEVLFRAATVRTLCQVEGVEYVEFYVNGQPLIKNDVPVGEMAALDFIDNTGEKTELTQKVNLTVYFTDITGSELKESLLVVENEGSRSLEELAIEQLINGPLESQTDLYPIMSPDTVLNKVSTRDGIAYVDFNEAFLNISEGLDAEVTIYAVVNTLCEIPNVTKVRFTINGEDVKNFEGIEFTGFFERRPELIATEKAGDGS